MGFFPFFVPFHYPLLGLHPSPDFTQNLRVSKKRWWPSRRQEVLGSRFGEVWSFADFFFFLLISTFFPLSSWQLPTPLTCSAAGALLAAEAWRRVGVRFRLEATRKKKISQVHFFSSSPPFPQPPSSLFLLLWGEQFCGPPTSAILTRSRLGVSSVSAHSACTWRASFFHPQPVASL